MTLQLSTGIEQFAVSVDGDTLQSRTASSGLANTWRFEAWSLEIQDTKFNWVGRMLPIKQVIMITER